MTYQSWSFVDNIRDAEPDGAWLVTTVPGGFRYECVEEGATLVIDRVDPHPDVTIGPCAVGESVTQAGSVALHEKP